jgi:PLP dependent protein
MSIRNNLDAIHQRIARAAERAGRNPADIRVMAVSKTMSADRIVEAYEAGQRLFGENRVQEFADKHEALRQLSGAEFHMIGHLQSNKAAKAVELFWAVDSLDSVKLGDKLNAAAEKLGKQLDVLIEINVGGEGAKSGANVLELPHILSAADGWSHLRVRGLMTVPPFTEDPEGARPYFRKLRELRDQVVDRGDVKVLSMGMSHDFEVAIEEGSSCVRIGTAIFGERAKP